MGRNESTPIRTVTIEEDGVLKLTGDEIRHLGGIKPGDKFVFEFVDDESFSMKKVPQQ